MDGQTGWTELDRAGRGGRHKELNLLTSSGPAAFIWRCGQIGSARPVTVSPWGDQAEHINSLWRAL